MCVHGSQVPKWKPVLVPCLWGSRTTQGQGPGSVLYRLGCGHPAHVLQFVRMITRLGEGHTPISAHIAKQQEALFHLWGQQQQQLLYERRGTYILTCTNLSMYSTYGGGARYMGADGVGGSWKHCPSIMRNPIYLYC